MAAGRRRSPINLKINALSPPVSRPECLPPERSKRVAIGGSILAIVLVVVAAVTGIWFAYIVAAVALLFAAFVWVRANREINGRGGNK